MIFHRTYVLIVFGVVFGVVAITLAQHQRTRPHMQIESTAFGLNEPIPVQYTCDSTDISPPLTFKNVPENAKSLVLIMDDPDAPMGTWVHWTLWNMDPKTTEIKKSRAPASATEGMTSFRRTGYGGPCPPSGTHRYFFKLFALDKKLNLSSQATKKDLTEAMKGHVLDQVELIGLYSRNR